MEQSLSEIKSSEIVNFVAEVFFEEIKYLTNNSKDKEFWIRAQGINSRAFSKDVLDITDFRQATETEIKEAFLIHLSRNSLYHHLPEYFFHPLVLSNPSMSNKELVSAIKHNRKIEKENIQFFIPFDTEFFNSHVRFTNRFLNIFTDTDAMKNLFLLARNIIDKDIPITKEQYYKLFLNLCNAEKLKENLPALEDLFFTIMGYEVRLKYDDKMHNESPFHVLGDGILGFTIGLQGSVQSEFQDISATMITENQLAYKVVQRHMTTIRMILEFFVFSNREINIKYQTGSKEGMALGLNYLSYNTVLG